MTKLILNVPINSPIWRIELDKTIVAERFIIFAFTYLVPIVKEELICEIERKKQLGYRGHGFGIEEQMVRFINYTQNRSKNSLNQKLNIVDGKVQGLQNNQFYTQKFSILHLHLKQIKFIYPTSSDMQYRQDAKLKSNQKKHTASSGLKVQQIVFDKEITQQWKVDTHDPTELLPFSLKKLYLSRICDFWHQLKFFYFQNYEQLTETNIKTEQVETVIDQVEAYSSVQIVHSSQRLEQCKMVTKKIWKITRQRLLKAFGAIKQQAGMEDDQSLELEDEKLNSYMRFLKLQQNKRIDLAIEIFDSVVQKNTRRKLLNAFLNMRERLKDARKKQAYSDRIKIECFVEIVMRNIRKLNSQVISQSFCDIYELSEGIKRQHEYEEVQRKRKQKQSIKIQRSKQLIDTSSNNNEHFKSISNKKVVINDDQQQQTIQNRDTINKYHNRYKVTDSKELRQNENHISTVKRQTQIQKEVMRNSHINSMASDYHSNVKSSNEKIIHSHYYYDQEEHLEDNQDDVQQYQENKYHQRRVNNMNSLPTRRETHTTKNNNHTQRNQYLINGIQNNINSETLYKKTVRTPSRSDVNKKSLIYHDIEFQTKNQSHQISNSHIHTQDPHMPVTQRIQKHYRQDHYQQQEEQQVSEQQQESSSDIHQQICVIRNFASTPARKPDRYEKIPIVSSNIEFKQFFLNSKQKRAQRNITIHSNSYYEKQCCEGCHYCLRLQRVKDLVQQISRQKHKVHKEHVIFENVEIKNQIISETIIQKDKTSNNVSKVDLSGIKKLIKQSRRQLESQQPQMDNINQNDFEIPNPKMKQISNNLHRQDERVQKQKIQPKSHLPNSPQYKQSNNFLSTPSSQLSAFTQGAKSKTLSERKVFVRKPMH